jgi:hypothetical protein
MRSSFQFALPALLFLAIVSSSTANAQEDLVAKAQKERELNVYGTALVRNSTNSPSPSSAVIRSSRPSTRERRVRR